jgi:RNA polymerase sigma-70 factor (ECF subfamily)
VELAAMMVLGSGRAFDMLYRRHAGAVRRVGVAVLHSADAADDLVQETFLELWRHRAGYAPERASMRTWLLSIARNRALDVVRAGARQARAVEAAQASALIPLSSSDALTETLARDQAARLHEALACLPPVQRRTLVLVYGGGLTHEEVARRTGVPLGTVKTRVRLGRRTIARRLEPGDRVETPSAA